jgi:hypothetical protein
MPNSVCDQKVEGLTLPPRLPPATLDGGLNTAAPLLT